MDEIVVVDQILNMGITKAKNGEIEKIKSIDIRVGSLSSLIPEKLIEYFKKATRGTVFQDANINIRVEESYMKCNNCGMDTPIRVNNMICPHCGSDWFQIVGDDSYYLENIDFE